MTVHHLDATTGRIVAGLAVRAGRALRVVLPDRRRAVANLTALHCHPADIIARSDHRDGSHGLDVFVAYAALQEADGEGRGGIRLLRRMLAADPASRHGDRALLTMLEAGGIDKTLYVPPPVAVDPGLRLIGAVAGLALAIRNGTPHLPVAVWKPMKQPRYDAAWFINRGFSAEDLEQIEAARQSAYERLGLQRRPWSELAQIHQELRQYLDPNATLHGGGGFYQSCEPLLIRGQRPTAARVDTYGLSSVLAPTDRLLDIGCNCGFLALHCAPFVREVVGIDVESRFVTMANTAQRFLGRDNCRFVQTSFDDFHDGEPFDVIFSFAVHHWISMPLVAYADRLSELLRPGGHILLESQDLNSHDADWDEKLAAVCSRGFSVARSGTLSDDGVRARAFVLLRDSR
jgi:2-polyprenyl-3-methyl-5-hydroxy-6-metoxy-1,4-benzoquinol methylase